MSHLTMPNSGRCEESAQRSQIEGPAVRRLVILKMQCSNQKESTGVPIGNAQKHPQNGLKHIFAANWPPWNIHYSPDKFAQAANKDLEMALSVRRHAPKFQPHAGGYCSSN